MPAFFCLPFAVVNCNVSVCVCPFCGAMFTGITGCSLPFYFFLRCRFRPFELAEFHYLCCAAFWAGDMIFINNICLIVCLPDCPVFTRGRGDLENFMRVSECPCPLLAKRYRICFLADERRRSEERRVGKECRSRWS